jgi:hypothetical protein
MSLEGAHENEREKKKKKKQKFDNDSKSGDVSAKIEQELERNNCYKNIRRILLSMRTKQT